MALERNGCAKFECRSAYSLARPFRTHPTNVAAIDFGTTNCSMMYLLAVSTMKEPHKADPVLLTLDDSHRVPNCALFDRAGLMKAFGLRAQRQYYNHTRPENLNQVFFFQKVKTHLQHDETLSRNTIVEAANGAKFYLVDVIAHILNWMKKRLLAEEAQLQLKATDFDWVITVPAMWHARGKQMMREAGYKAGLCTNNEPPPLCQACNTTPQMIVEHNPDKLTLALEPECATFRCRQAAGFEEEEVYLVVDIGGGTVDIVSHAVVRGHLEELKPPQGNDWGGGRVNEAFSSFLGNTLGDPSFSRFIGPEVEEVTRDNNKRDLDYLIYKEFEDIKRDFGTHDEEGVSPGPFYIQLPHSFWCTYEKNMMVNDEKDISFDLKRHELRIDGSKMVELFEPTIEGIVSIVESVLEDVRAIDNVYLAGGFGACYYVKMNLKCALEKNHPDVRLHPPPGRSELGICHGAVLYRCSPFIVHKRKADATYGIACSAAFLPGKHDESKKEWCEDLKEYYCHDLFCTIVELEDSINSGSVYVSHFRTLAANQTAIDFNIYSSSRKNVWYITDPDVQKLGHFTFDLSGVASDQCMELTVQFTNAEIQFRSYAKQNPGYERKAVVDFLDPKK